MAVRKLRDFQQDDDFNESTTRRKRVNESIDTLEPEIVKDRGAKIYNETIKILDYFGSRFVSASMYAYDLKQKKLADKTLYKLAQDMYSASGILQGYAMEHRNDYK